MLKSKRIMIGIGVLASLLYMASCQKNTSEITQSVFSSDRIVGANNYSPLQGTTATLSLKSVPSGVYLLRVTDTEGREYHQKIIKK